MPRIHVRLFATRDRTDREVTEFEFEGPEKLAAEVKRNTLKRFDLGPFEGLRYELSAIDFKGLEPFVELVPAAH